MSNMFQKNKIARLLLSLNLCNEDSVKVFYLRVRDRKDVKVMRCQNCGVIFLSRTDHISEKHYTRMKINEYWSSVEKMRATEDDQIRAKKYGAIISGKKWLDVGTGMGGILDLIAKRAKKAVGVEPQKDIRNDLKRRGFEVVANLNKLPDGGFDIVTLFHVLEHLDDPIGTLSTVRRKMTKNGTIIIEVPHAKDFLITPLNLESFKAFTFWSEHLMLHTRKSLEVFLKKVGFKKVRVVGYQRYFLANHLYWIIKGVPGGQNHLRFLDNRLVNRLYSSLLDKIDHTDTLAAFAQK